MLFNSLAFALFFPVVFALYWWVLPRNRTGQNALLLVASYVFYGWWDWRFLALIAASTLVDFAVGSALSRRQPTLHRRLLLTVSIVFNLGLLGFFKYFNFFVESAVSLLQALGYTGSVSTLSIILPVGISFYTFQTMSYTLDVYRGKLAPTKDLLSFATFVAFFPQLVAGPIERASHLLPQFAQNRSFDRATATDGMRQILYGLFKKIVIADTCARLANPLFEHYELHNSWTLMAAAILFAFQIYGDFSGYSDIAIGTARLLGFNLMQNFATPYFSRDIGEFWRRWHISLSTWFRDYLYIPLGGNRRKTARVAFNVFVVFAVSGLWHGANWTFVIWGLLHAAYLIFPLLRGTHRRHLDRGAGSSLNARTLWSMLRTFALTTFAWIFFRAPDLDYALSYISRMATSWEMIWIGPAVKPTLVLLTLFISVEWWGRGETFAFARIREVKSAAVRAVVYFAVITALFWYSEQTLEFIYFQF